LEYRLNRVHRTLSWYERNGDALVGEVDLRTIPLAQLRKWFGLGASNPMADSFAVGPKQAEQLRAALGRPINLDRYSYFVESSAVVMKGAGKINAQKGQRQRISLRNGNHARRAAG
jgi:hypothetical protein